MLPYKNEVFKVERVNAMLVDVRTQAYDRPSKGWANLSLECELDGARNRR